MWNFDILRHATQGTKAIESITLNMSKIDMLSLHPETFARMYKLKFLKIHSWPRDCKHRLCAPLGIESLSDELRILRWDYYPLKSLPLSFCAENLVEIIMLESRLEKLWDGVQVCKFFSLTYNSEIVKFSTWAHVMDTCILNLFRIW